MKKIKNTLLAISLFGLCLLPLSMASQTTTKNPVKKTNYKVTTSPNPFTDKIVVTIINPIKRQNCSIVISDINGKIVRMEPILIHKGKNSILIKLSDLPAGTYFLNSTDSKIISKAIRIFKL